MAVSILDAAVPFAAGPSEVLFQGDYVVDNVGRSYDVSPDGQRFLMLKDADAVDEAPLAQIEAPLSQIIVVQSWQEELKRLLPN